MTTTRPEIQIEGSLDGEHWLPYKFRYKPGLPERAPRWVAPFQPRLDWQMWFAALGNLRQNPWFAGLVLGLLQGSTPVLDLLEPSPFGTKPPKFVRAMVYEYQFTNFDEHARTGDYWKRELKGMYSPRRACGASLCINQVPAHPERYNNPCAAPHPPANDTRRTATNPAQSGPSRGGREDGRFWRLGHAGAVLRHHRRAPRGARTPSGCSTSATWARSRSAGPKRWTLVNYVTTNDAAKLHIGQAHYSGLLYEHGGFVDDILVHKVADDHYFLCVNASNQDKDYEHIRGAQPFGMRRWRIAGPRYAQIAVQGPQGAGDAAEADARPIWLRSGITGSRTARSRDVPARIARTGYTGEDGFEIYVAPEEAPQRVERAPGRGRGVRHQALRAGRAQHAAPGSGDGALRPRDRRLDHAARSRASAGSSSSTRATSSGSAAL